MNYDLEDYYFKEQMVYMLFFIMYVSLLHLENIYIFDKTILIIFLIIIFYYYMRRTWY